MFQMHCAQRTLNEIESALKETFIWMKEHALGTKDIFCLKSYIESHRIHQLGSLA